MKKLSLVAALFLAACNGGKPAPATPAPAASATPATLVMTSGTSGKGAAASGSEGCPALPAIRLYGGAWSAHLGVDLAAGGARSLATGEMFRHGLDLELRHEEDEAKLQDLLVRFAEGVKAGDANPKDGAHFVMISGDGTAAFLKPVNDRLKKLGPDYTAAVIAAVGFSRGEDQVLGPAAWKSDAKKAKGGVIAAVVGGRDWNLALKWLADAKVKSNADDSTWDPDAVNWVSAKDDADAATKWADGFCAERKNRKSGKLEKRCVDAIAVRSPAAVLLAGKKAGLGVVASTSEKPTLIPCVVIGNKKWMSANRKVVEGFLAAAFEGGDAVNASEENRKAAAAIESSVFENPDAAAGGSAVAGMKENVALFGLPNVSNTDFGDIYTSFAVLMKSQFPKRLTSYEYVGSVVDTTYLREMMDAPPAPK